MTMSIEECVEVLEDMCNVDLTEREFEALSLAIKILSRLNEGFISNAIDYCVPKGVAFVSKKEIVKALINSLVNLLRNY
jgi:hypothetical protein